VFALLLVSQYVPGIHVESFYVAVIVAVILGVINLTIRPVLWVLTLPITLLTFGLFSFVLNALLFWFVASFVDGFTVSGFIPAFVGAFIIALVRFVTEKFID
jgi:putative membrane protein